MIYSVEKLHEHGLVDVYVDGKYYKYVFYADTKKGVVKYYEDPIRIHKHKKRAISRTARGVVTVFPKAEAQ